MQNQEKPVFELMSSEEFYAVTYKGKEYQLQHTCQCNPDYYENTLYDTEGNKISDITEIYQEITQAFGELK